MAARSNSADSARRPDPDFLSTHAVPIRHRLVPRRAASCMDVSRAVRVADAA